MTQKYEIHIIKWERVGIIHDRVYDLTIEAETVEKAAQQYFLTCPRLKWMGECKDVMFRLEKTREVCEPDSEVGNIADFLVVSDYEKQYFAIVSSAMLPD